PPLVPADLPRVRRKDFDPYLRAVAPDWDRLQLAPVALPRPSSLDTVPHVFFSPAFALSDPRTFSAVTADADPTALLEKFSHYADTVEQHLVLEISHRAPSFFAALTNLHDLHAESELCLHRIASLRALLTDLDSNTAKKGLVLVRRQARAANLAIVTDAVKQVASVVEMGRVARALVAAGQWGQALAVIEEMHSMWQQHSTDTKPPMPTLAEEDEDVSAAKKLPHIPLSSLRAYAALPEHLRALTTEIAASLSSELVSVLRNDLTQRNDRDTDADLRDRLRPLIQGLVRTRGVKEGLLSWREAVLGLVRQIVRSLPCPSLYLPLFQRLPNEEDNEEAKAPNRTHFRDMRHPEFMLLLQTLYADLLKCIQGIQSQSNVILDILEAETGKLSPPPQDELTDILASASELANTHSATLLAFRHQVHTALPLADFLSLFNATWSFVVRCEVLSHRMIVGLRGVVVGQAKAFLQAFHQARITTSAKLVEDELWNPAEISGELQKIADAIVGSAVGDAPELLVGIGEDTPLDTPPPRSNANANKSKHLRIEDRTYFAVSATAEVLVLLLDYLRVVVNLSMLTTEVMSRVVEFLKAFNSRTCQVVLGAGAMRSAGLKNITAKHLALASQSLSIMFELIPYVRETFRRHLSPKQAVMLVEFDKLKRDYQEHQNEIHSKLIAIMGDRLNAHIRSLQAVDWNVPPKPGGGVNDYVEILVKETVTLHKVLSRYLSVPVVEYVMTQVFAAINHGLSEEYNKIELPNQEAKTRLLADARYLHQKLSALKNVAPPSGMLVTVVSEKSIPKTGPPSPIAAPVPTPTRSNTLSSANQRLKGLLSGKSANFDKALPTPIRSSSVVTSSPLISPPMNGTSSSPQARRVSAGFKQVEVPLAGGPERQGDGSALPEKAAKSPDGENQQQRSLRTLSPQLPRTPHDTPFPPELVGPDADTEPEAQKDLKTEYAKMEIGSGEGKVGPDMGPAGDEGAQMDDGVGRAALDTGLDSVVPSQSECPETLTSSPTLPPTVSSEAPPAV
ncbi:Vacuolar protein sorting-associated protein 54, partial [Termitomyces sp. J132]